MYTYNGYIVYTGAAFKERITLTGVNTKQNKILLTLHLIYDSIISTVNKLRPGVYPWCL